MKETSTNTSRGVRSNIVATTPLALAAVTEHMMAYDLPAFRTLHAPNINEPTVFVELNPETVDAWLDSVVDDDEHNLGIVGRLERVAYDVRLSLPVGEIRVSLRSFRQPVTLRAVGAAS